MSVFWLSAVMNHTPTITATQAMLLLVLADAANDDGASWPSVETLASKAHVDERNARRGIKALESAGFFQRQRRVRLNGSSASNVYLLSPSLIPCPDGCSCPLSRVDSDKGGGRSAPVGGRSYPPHIEPSGNQGFHAPAHTPAHVPINAKKKSGEAPRIAQDATRRDSHPESRTQPAERASLQAALPDDDLDGPTAEESTIRECERLWNVAYMTHSPGGMLHRALIATVSALPPEQHHDFCRAFGNYVNNTSAVYVSIPKFVATWRSYINPIAGRPQSVPSNVIDEVFGPAPRRIP